MNRRQWTMLSMLALLPVGLMGACDSDDSTTPGTATPSATGTASGTATGTASGTASGIGGGLTTGGNGTGGAGNASTGGNGTGGSAIPPMPTSTSECQGHIYACGDLLDNDGDGLVDSQDPDCLGPCDATEDSYIVGIPGSTGPGCAVDCYFDQDSGAGNDDCYWDHRCDPISVGPDYYPEPWLGDKCEYWGPDEILNPPDATCQTLLNTGGQSQDCLDFCLPLTPNGCDCFGCCELPAGSGDYVWLGSEGTDGTTVCNGNDVTDPTICHPCTPVADCMNDCGYCELCLGKTTLPPECFGSGGMGAGGMGAGGAPPDRCPPNIQPCGLPGDEPCDPGFFCITGCCMAVPR